MPIVTRFSHLSDIEFERELEQRARSGQLVLGAEITKEMMERVRRWVACDEVELDELRTEVQRLQMEVENLEEELKNVNT